MTPLERERLRVFRDAQFTVVEEHDPDEFQTVEDVLAGRGAEVAEKYRQLANADVVLREMES